MVPEIWSMIDRIFVILGHFLHPKNQNFENTKKTLEISSFYTSVLKIMIICYTVSEIWCMNVIVIFHSGLFFALLPPLTAQKIKFKKKLIAVQQSS